MATIDLKCCEPQIVRNKFDLLLKISCRLLHLSFKQLLLCFLRKHLLTSWAWRLQGQSFCWAGKWSLLLIDRGPIRSSRWVLLLGMLIFNNSFFRWPCSFHLLVFPLSQSTVFCFCSGHTLLQTPAVGQISPSHGLFSHYMIAAMRPSVMKMAKMMPRGAYMHQNSYLLNLRMAKYLG